MEHIKVLGYFKDNEGINPVFNDKLLYFVAYENSYNYSQRDQAEGKTWCEGFNVIDGHFQLKDKDYIKICEEITKDQYLQATKGFYTPKEYL